MASKEKTSSLPTGPRPKRAVSKFPAISLNNLDFESLVRVITHIHDRMVAQAARAVNVSLTMRNWLIGFYIREYELEGNDRAVYGERLFAALPEKLTSQGVSNCNRRQLYRYRDFYSLYPQIVGTASPQFENREEMQRFIEEKRKEVGYGG